MLAAALAPLALLAAGVEPGDAKDKCGEARALYEALSLERAVEVADDGLKENAEQLRCLEVKALALLVLGQVDRARSTLQDLFERSPDYAIDDPSLSPVLHDTIRQIRDMMKPIQASVRARWVLPEELRIDVVLEGGLRDASKIRYSVETAPAGERRSGEAQLLGRAATATVAVSATSQVTKAKVSGSILSDSDKLLARFEQEVGLFDRPKPAEPQVVEKGTILWPVWVGIGLAVVGAGVAVAIFAQPKVPDAGPGALGRVQIP